MKLVRVQPKPPPALRVLVQGSDDAGSIEFSLAAAAAWSDKPILVVNATGKDLAAFAERYQLIEIRDDQDRPSRSLTEIVGVLEQLDAREFGSVVVLDANRIYRATRCAVRDAKQVESLSAGHWDTTNEALGLLGETLTRLGLPSVFYAPPSDVYGVSDDGEAAIVGTKAQAWKDLPRSCHLHVCLSRKGQCVAVEVAGDDWNRLGKPGTVLYGATGRSVGEAVADLARGARPGEVGGTTLAESSAAEIAARQQRATARSEKSAEIRNRLVNIALLRVHQGRWDEFTAEVSEAIADLEPADFNLVSKRMDEVLHAMRESIHWMRGAEADLDRTGFSLHDMRENDPAMAGPAIGPRPPTASAIAAKYLSGRGGIAQHEMRNCPPAELYETIASLGIYAGVWSDAPFAALCRATGVPARGPSWTSYAVDELRQLGLVLLSLSITRQHYDKPSAPAEPVKLRACPEPVNVDEPSDRGPDHCSITFDLPTIAEFKAMPKGEASDFLSVMLTRGGWRDHVRDLFADPGSAPGKPHLVHTWTPIQRVTAYQVLLADVERRMAS